MKNFIHTLKVNTLVAFFFFGLLFIGIGIICGIFIGDNSKKEYPQSMVVVQIDEATDTVTCEDATGNLWQFKDVEDWCIDDVAAMIMNDNGTAEISDDEIISVRYCGSRSDG